MKKLDKSRLITNLGKKYRLVPYLDKALKDFDEPWEFKYEPKKGDDAWHPSGDCTPEPLALYEKASAFIAARKTAEPPPSDFVITESLRKSFMVGHYWHQLLQHIVLHKLEFCEPYAIERRGSKYWGTLVPSVFADQPPKADPFHWATGSGDIAPLILPSGWEGVVDFKTMNTAAFNSKYVPFADKYECQINIYMEFFDVDRALILGIQKDSPHALKEFEYVRNQPLINGIHNKWIYVSSLLDKGEFDDVEVTFDLPLTGPINV